MALSVPIEHSTNALVMSTPVSAIWVGVALFGRAAVPLVTLSTMAAWAAAGASHATTSASSARTTDRLLLERSGIDTVGASDLQRHRRIWRRAAVLTT